MDESMLSWSLKLSRKDRVLVVGSKFNDEEDVCTEGVAVLPMPALVKA